MQASKESFTLVSKLADLNPNQVIHHFEYHEGYSPPDRRDLLFMGRSRFNYHDNIFFLTHVQQTLEFEALSPFMDRIEAVGMDVGDFGNWMKTKFVPEHSANLSSLREFVIFDKKQNPTVAEDDCLPLWLLNSSKKPRGAYYKMLAKFFRDMKTRYSVLEVLQNVQLLFAEEWTAWWELGRLRNLYEVSVSSPPDVFNSTG